MEKRAIDFAKALVRLSEVTIFELRGEWRRLHPHAAVDAALPRSLDQGITLQASGSGRTVASPWATARKLEQASADPQSRGAAKPTLDRSVSSEGAKSGCGS